MVKTKKKAAVVKKHQMHATDTGSTPVQVAILSTRIDELAKHLKTHKKDNHSRRGLLKMVADRRTHLKYLQRKDKAAYDDTIKKLELK
jgi:small subunit ribosomal protein S15